MKIDRTRNGTTSKGLSGQAFGPRQNAEHEARIAAQAARVAQEEPLHLAGDIDVWRLDLLRLLAWHGKPMYHRAARRELICQAWQMLLVISHPWFVRTGWEDRDEEYIGLARKGRTAAEKLLEEES